MNASDNKRQKRSATPAPDASASEVLLGSSVFYVSSGLELTSAPTSPRTSQGPSRNMLPPSQGAWLLLGDDESRKIFNDLNALSFGDEEASWTGAETISAGDKLFFYFTSPDKAIEYVGIATESPSWVPDAAILSKKNVEPHKWMVPFSSVVRTSPISYAQLCEIGGQRFILRSKSAIYLKADVANALLSALQIQDSPSPEITRLVLTPLTSRDAQPSGAKPTLQRLAKIPAGTFSREAQIETQFVDPLLQLAGLQFERQYKIARQVADYAIVRDGKPVGIVEVKRRFRLNRSRVWQTCPDVQQAREYADRLGGLPFVLIDCEEICLFDAGTGTPKQEFLRRDLSQSLLKNLQSHFSASSPKKATGMRALSVRQPYAELFMRGEKEPMDHSKHGRVNVEYRSGPTKVRERIYIYASATATDYERQYAKESGLDLDELPRGVLIGTVELVGCDGGHWYVKSPQRLDRPLKPQRRANPIWFYPFEEDVPRS